MIHDVYRVRFRVTTQLLGLKNVFAIVPYPVSKRDLLYCNDYALSPPSHTLILRYLVFQIPLVLKFRSAPNNKYQPRPLS
ncbi:unnamed protein product [Somion occarium]|uniref:Uncharacterized protein n=1 Tax=Somion occarium TaxID=3059160 RepID=A0ABP1DBF1_9APHY